MNVCLEVSEILGFELQEAMASHCQVDGKHIHCQPEWSREPSDLWLW